MLSLDRVSGYCWTQFADTYQEVNGLLDENREPKAPLELIARAALGQPAARTGTRPPALTEVPTMRSAPGQGSSSYASA